jgi:hypothetical protein
VGRRCLPASAEVGGVALIIDAKNERVAGWYASYGAVPLLVLPFSLDKVVKKRKTTLESALLVAGRIHKVELRLFSI